MLDQASTLDISAYEDLAHQAPVLFLYVASGFAVLKMIFSHLKTEGKAMREVLSSLSKETHASALAITALTEVVRGMPRGR